MVGSTKVVVVVGGLLGVVVEGADVGATVEGTAVVDVDVGAELADAVEFFAVAFGSLLTGLVQAALPKPKTTSVETVAHLIFRILMTPSAAGNEA